MKQWNRTEVKEIKKTLSKIVCDGCGKEITEAYFEVETHHRDWGNDSHESFECFDFCSVDCFIPHMKHYFSNAYGTESYDVERYVPRIGHE